LQKNSLKNKFFKIGKFDFKKKKTFIVAEISSNHNKSYSRAVNLIKKAKKIGVDAVKLQTYTADTITLKSNRKDFSLDHIKDSSWKKYKNFYSIYNHGSTPWKWHKKLFRLAKKLKIEIFSSPFDETAVTMLENLNCVAYKVASPEINHIPLLIKIAKTKKPVILSTGLAKISDIDLAIKTLKKNGSNKIFILKCNSSYPAPLEESNLRNIPYLRKKYNLPIGLSDHSKGNTAAISAVTLGACIIEKHFNLGDKKKTLDSFFSLDEKDFELMVDKIRETEKVLGEHEYSISKSSIKNLKARRSIYVSKNIKKNEKISKSNVKVVRPGLSLHPKYYNKIIGKKVKKNLKIGDRLKLNYLS
jgi:pseudaminic acid synthase